MNEKDIRAYAEILRDNDLTALEIGADGSVRLERTPAPVQVVPTTAPGGYPAVQTSTQAQSPASQSAASAVSGAPSASEHQAAPQEDASKIVTSPMIGMFYVAPEENADPFVSVGDTVAQGDVLCIIEAMKLMNEITADIEGEIAEVLATNGSVVEFGQPLFRLV